MSMETDLSLGSMDDLDRGMGLRPSASENEGTTKKFLGKLFKKGFSKDGSLGGGKSFGNSGGFFSSFSIGDKESKPMSNQSATRGVSGSTFMDRRMSPGELPKVVVEGNETTVSAQSRRVAYLGTPTLGLSPIVKPWTKGEKGGLRPSAYMLVYIVVVLCSFDQL